MSEKKNALQGSATTQMTVRKRNGQFEPVNLEKILKAVTRSSKGIPGVDCYRVAVKTIGGIYDGTSTLELDKLSIETAASFIPEHENYSKLAAALLAEFIRKEVATQGIESFSQSFFEAQRLGLVGEPLVSVQDSARKLDNAIDDTNNSSFEYYALRTVYETHLSGATPRRGSWLQQDRARVPSRDLRAAGGDMTPADSPLRAKGAQMRGREALSCALLGNAGGQRIGPTYARPTRCAASNARSW